LGRFSTNPRLLVIVAERSSQLLDSGVEAVIKSTKVSPGQAVSRKLLAGDDFAGMLQEQGKHLKGSAWSLICGPLWRVHRLEDQTLKNVKACDKGEQPGVDIRTSAGRTNYNTPRNSRLGASRH